MALTKFHGNAQASLELLDKVQKFFLREIKLTPMIAIELEFFFVPQKDKIVGDKEIDEVLRSIEEIAQNHGVKIEKATREVGKLQFEVNFHYTDDLKQLILDVEEIKKIISHVGLSHDMSASFEPKPFGEKEVGSGMHVHVSLWKEGKNFFQKVDGEETELFLWAVGGLLELMKESLVFMIEKKEDLNRFKSKFEIGEEEKRFRCNATNAPINVSWGYNNRTAAIRIPEATQEPKRRRVEYRVASSNADPALVVAAILVGVLFGLQGKVDPIEKTWGNAFDVQYGLEPLLSDDVELVIDEGNRVVSFLEDLK